MQGRAPAFPTLFQPHDYPTKHRITIRQTQRFAVNRLRGLMAITRWLFSCLFLGAGGAHAAVIAQLEVATHVEPRANSTNTPPDSRHSVELILADRYFVITSSTETAIYDFDKRVRVVIDRATKTRVNYSLYDAVGFRVFELRNRAVLGQAIAAAKVGQGVMAPVDNEHNLAIQEKPSSPLQARPEGTDEVFVFDSKVLLRRSLRSTPTSPEEARMFAQFVRYTYGGHPQILTELAKANAIPEQIVLITNEIGVNTRTITVKSVRSTDAAPIDVSTFALRQATPPTDPLEQALDRAAALTPTELATARRRNKEETAAAFREGRAFDAFLGMSEGSLMTGEAIVPLGADQKALFQSDVSVRRLSAALGVRNKEDLASASNEISELRSQTLTKGYVLKVFEANDRGILGDRNAARKLFLEVLAVNPAIAGVYKDLGDVLLNGFDAPHAWRAWDFGRMIAPNFANFEAVNQLERSLAATHPEYF